MLRVFDLFAGIGGFRLGFEREGYKCVGFCEIDKYARTLYKAYYKTEEKGEFEWDDIQTIPIDDIPDFDILTAGFPCQSFSVMGKRRGLHDERAYPLWRKMFEIVERKKPKICVFENVKGLLSADRGWAFAFLLYQMAERGYDAEWSLFNSKAFGVPQHRERIYIIFRLRGECGREILPIREVEKVYYKPPNAEKESSEDNKEIAIALTARQYASWRGNFVCEPEIQQVGYIDKNYQAKRVYSPEGLSVTLAANGGGWGAKTGLYLVNGRIRRLTPLECFRLQGFPDDIYYKAKELGISDTQLYKMTGNSVTVQIPQSIARKIRKVYNF